MHEALASTDGRQAIRRLVLELLRSDNDQVSSQPSTNHALMPRSHHRTAVHSSAKLAFHRVPPQVREGAGEVHIRRCATHAGADAGIVRRTAANCRSLCGCRRRSDGDADIGQQALAMLFRVRMNPRGLVPTPPKGTASGIEVTVPAYLDWCGC